MIISILHTEKQIQLKDITRFDASRSILVKGSIDPINSIKIMGGSDGPEIEVFNPLSKNWFLDFVFNEYKFDVDETNSRLSIEIGNNIAGTNVLSGTYTLVQLLEAMKIAVELEIPSLEIFFELEENNKIKINSSMPLKILPKFSSNDLFQHLGFDYEGQMLGHPVEYGLRKISLTVSSLSESNTAIEYIRVYSVEGDALFSDDADLMSFENDIIKWLTPGRATYLDIHRRSQKLILDWIDRQGYRDNFNNKITKFAFVDNSDVRMWSVYLSLKLFFTGVQNSTDDVFKKKAEHYHKLEIEARDRAVLSLDLNGDGKKDLNVSTLDIHSGRLLFR